MIPTEPTPGSPSPDIPEIVDAIATTGWVTTTALLTPLESATLAEECQAHWQLGTFHKAATGRGSDKKIREDIRSDQVHWLEPDLLSLTQKIYFQRIDALRAALNRHLFLGLDSFEAHFATYPEGSFYARHLDRHAGTLDRIITIVYYLNRDWSQADGGQLRLYHGETHTDTQPDLGQAIIFLAADYPHEVLPATRTRMSITGWLRQRPR